MLSKKVWTKSIHADAKLTVCGFSVLHSRRNYESKRLGDDSFITIVPKRPTAAAHSTGCSFTVIISSGSCEHNHLYSAVAVVEQIADGVIGPLLRKDVVGFDMTDDVVAEGIRCCRHVAAAVVYGFLKNLGIAGMIVRIDEIFGGFAVEAFFDANAIWVVQITDFFRSTVRFELRFG